MCFVHLLGQDWVPAQDVASSHSPSHPLSLSPATSCVLILSVTPPSSSATPQKCHPEVSGWFWLLPFVLMPRVPELCCPAASTAPLCAGFVKGLILQIPSLLVLITELGWLSRAVSDE